MSDAAATKSEVSTPKFDRIIGVFGVRHIVGAQPDPTTRQRPDYNDYDAVVKTMGSIPGYSSGKIKVVSGGSKGVERLVEQWCKECGVPFERIKPDTDNNKDNPFDVRNSQIVAISSEIMILWDGVQPGFDQIAQMAVVFGKKVTLIPVKQ